MAGKDNNLGKMSIAEYNSMYLLFIAHSGVKSARKLASKIIPALGTNVDHKVIESAIYNVYGHRFKLPLWLAKATGKAFGVDYRMLFPSPGYSINKQAMAELEELHKAYHDRVARLGSNGEVVLMRAAKKIIKDSGVNVYNNPAIVYRGKKNDMYLYLADVLMNIVSHGIESYSGIPDGKMDFTFYYGVPENRFLKHNGENIDIMIDPSLYEVLNSSGRLPAGRHSVQLSKKDIVIRGGIAYPA